MADEGLGSGIVGEKGVSEGCMLVIVDVSLMCLPKRSRLFLGSG